MEKGLSWLYFNPRFPWGKRRGTGCTISQSATFQSTLPVGEATLWLSVNEDVAFDFNPRFPWGKRRYVVIDFPLKLDFNPRFPWGKRPFLKVLNTCTVEFQSTLPVGEATIRVGDVLIWNYDFNPRFPWGKRPSCGLQLRGRRNISIHASRGGSDIWYLGMDVKNKISIHASRGGSDVIFFGFRLHPEVFQSTLPVGEATLWIYLRKNLYSHFNPRFPWGKRQHRRVAFCNAAVFQSTLPVGEAT